MKKILALILGVVFVMGFAASAFAIHAAIPAETTAVGSLKDVQIRIGGEMRVRGWYEKNIGNVTIIDDIAEGELSALRLPYDKHIRLFDLLTGTPDELGRAESAWYDQRYRLFLDVKSGDNLSGRLMLESGSAQSDVHVWGSTDVTTGNGAKTSTLSTVLEGWVAYTGSGLLGMPAGIKIGHMPTVIGAATFYDHRRFGDDAILLYLEPMKGTEINLLIAKLGEGTNVPSFVSVQKECRNPVTGATTFVDLGAACPATAINETGGTRIFSTAAIDAVGGTLDNTDDTDIYSLMLNHSIDKDTKVGLNYSYINNSDLGMKLQNLGVTAAGSVPDIGLGFKATGDMQFGNLYDDGTDKLKQRGYAVTLGANYKLDPVTLRASFAYGSGDDTDDDKNKTFFTSLSNVINYTVVYEYRVMSAAGGLGTGIANTTYYNIGVDLAPIKDLKVALDYYLLRASKSWGTDSNEIGNKKDIGSEIDLKMSYKLAKNLTYFINSGILFAGDFYKSTALISDAKPKDAVVFHHGLTFSF